MMDAHLNMNAAPALFNYPVIDQFMPQPAQIQVQPKLALEQPIIQAVPINNAVNGIAFKLPSVQDRLIKNRVFFDENMKNVTQ